MALHHLGHMERITITLWDSNPARIAETEKNIHLAFAEAGKKYSLIIMSELPLIGRRGLAGKLPVLEIGKNIWSWKQGEAIPKHAISLLIAHIEQGDASSPA